MYSAFKGKLWPDCDAELDLLVAYSHAHSQARHVHEKNTLVYFLPNSLQVSPRWEGLANAQAKIPCHAKSGTKSEAST